MSELSTDVKAWFATPLASVSLPGHAALNHDLRNVFLSREDESHRHHIRIPTQVGAVFESRFDLFEWPDAPIRTLSNFIHEALSGMVASVNGYSGAEMEGFEFFYDSWFHITRSAGYQSIHSHPNASWSGIYCVEPGDSPEDRPESGQVKFYDPRGAGPQMHFDPANRQLDPRFSTTPVYLTHRAGQLVMFPSWLFHEVLPYHGQRERIVVAFNAWLEDA